MSETEPKRNKGTGFRQLKKSGKWTCQIIIGKDSSGNRNRWYVYGDTREEVAQKMKEIRADHERTTTIAKAKALNLLPADVSVSGGQSQQIVITMPGDIRITIDTGHPQNANHSHAQ
jgi:hypothetical protein